MQTSPLQLFLQQREARPVAGQHLEHLGKEAATNWVLGKCASLHEAAVNVLRAEQLSPEQVRRVVEFTNQNAYLQEFRKEGDHKVVHFDCGPADPAQVLQDLNDGGGGSLYDQGNLHHRAIPTRTSARGASMDKTASAQDQGIPGLPKLTRLPGLPKAASVPEEELWGLFQTDASGALPYAEPRRPLMDVRSKLAGVQGELEDAVNQLELDYQEASSQLYHQVKQAALTGESLGSIVAAWATVSEAPVFTKAAFAMLTPLLRHDGVFPSLDSIGASLEKQASGVVNGEHPLVRAYADFVNTLGKLAAARGLHQEYLEGVALTEELLKNAAGGVVGAVKATGKGIDAISGPLAHALVGPADAKKVAPSIARGLKLTAGGAAVLGTNAAVQNVTDRPGVQRVLQAAKSTVPGTMEYQNRRYRNMTGM